MALGRSLKRRMGREREDWIDISNFDVWQILKILQTKGGEAHVRGIAESFKGSWTTCEVYINRLVRWRLVEERREGKKRILTLTPDGVELLNCLDKIGNIVAKIRERRGAS